MKLNRVPTVVLILMIMAGVAYGQVMDEKILTLEGAKKVIDAARAEAKRLGAPGGSIAIVDSGGYLMALERLDGSFAASAIISTGKARTAAIFKRSTKVFEEIINKGRTAMTALTDFTPLQGGVPIELDGKIIGAIGVSGAASVQQDEEIALAGAMAVKFWTAGAAASLSVTYIDKDNVAAAFAKGTPLLETDQYKVHASRREAPGLAEIHLWETDVFYVLDGSATLVTGGKAVDPKSIAAGEIRGSEIAGGESRRLSKGDVVIIPKGVAHWFKKIHQAPFLYFVVKPISREME